MTKIELSDRELSMVIAALRYWQSHVDDLTDEEYVIVADHFGADAAGPPLADLEIDELCDKINR